MARAVDAVGFNCLSAAYVAGAATGAIGSVRVLRPSVVVRHSETLAYPGPFVVRPAPIPA
ncbi:hypothetical protein PV682_39215 [Streptomyces niveiscabiei]|uniref:hypothetical protein n=1 Tax=Streptomyces niveiscabiei TaxID=164115 RepID=UPI0029B6DB3C|nr:hypothetical protein [Streptomyces niveiscabiei]MDX3387432.1 hypothetical protein [Streptomyces niveiscabiei]